MALHPVGPLPASVYWRRRIVLLVGLIALLMVVRSCATGDSPKRDAGAHPTPTPTASTKPTPRPTRPAATTAGGLCADSALTLTASADAETYSVGASPKITLTVKNRSTVGCRRDLGTGAVELLVYSGPDRVWSSDDCNDSKAKELVTLAAGASREQALTWSGKRSAPGCGGTRAEVKAGTYRVLARIGTLRVQGAVFRFHD